LCFAGRAGVLSVETISKMKHAKCTADKVVSDIVYGTQTEKTQFGGMVGLDHFVTTLIDEHKK